MQKLIVSIPEPCHESWDKMSATEQGRFCNACAKQVVDFSNMSDAEMINYFSKLTTEKVCGRVYTDQLDREITKPQEIKKRKFWYWNYVAMLLLFFSKFTSTKAQLAKKTICELPKNNNQFDSISKYNPNRTRVVRLGGVTSYDISKAKAIYVVNGNILPSSEDINADDIEAINILQGPAAVALFGPVGANGAILITTKEKIIKGQVVDKDGKPVPFASITRGRTGVAADASGRYTFRAKIGDRLTISASGLEPNIVTVGNSVTMTTILNESKIMKIQGLLIMSTSDYLPVQNISNHVAQLLVIDDKTNLPISKASIIIQNEDWDKPKTATSDKRGKYKFRKIKTDHTYTIKVNAEGYDVTEFTIDENDFKDRKEDWEIRLAKKETPVYNNRDTVKVKTSFEINSVVLGHIHFAKAESIQKDSLFTKIKDVIIPDPNKLKIFPNPIHRATTFDLSLELIKPGTNLLRITNDAGIVIMQRQILATGKAQKENVTVDATWAAGMYYIFIIDASDKLLTKGSFIVQ